MRMLGCVGVPIRLDYECKICVRNTSFIRGKQDINRRGEFLVREASLSVTKQSILLARQCDGVTESRCISFNGEGGEME